MTRILNSSASVMRRWRGWSPWSSYLMFAEFGTVPNTHSRSCRCSVPLWLMGLFTALRDAYLMIYSRNAFRFIQSIKFSPYKSNESMIYEGYLQQHKYFTFPNTSLSLTDIFDGCSISPSHPHKCHCDHFYSKSRFFCKLHPLSALCSTQIPSFLANCAAHWKNPGPGGGWQVNLATIQRLTLTTTSHTHNPFPQSAHTCAKHKFIHAHAFMYMDVLSIHVVNSLTSQMATLWAALKLPNHSNSTWSVLWLLGFKDI